MAFEIGDRLNDAIFRDQNDLSLRLGRLNADINQVGPRRLREYWRNIPGAAEVDASDIQGFQHLRARRELNPGECGLREACFQKLMAFSQHHTDAAFLIADA